VLPYLAQRDTPLGRWVQLLLARAHKNIVVVALANKLARIAWAVLAHGKPFDAVHMANA
jgi:transposase